MVAFERRGSDDTYIGKSPRVLPRRDCNRLCAEELNDVVEWKPVLTIAYDEFSTKHGCRDYCLANDCRAILKNYIRLAT
jgi:hypothetical protein